MRRGLNADLHTVYNLNTEQQYHHHNEIVGPDVAGQGAGNVQ